ncbi:MAG: LysM peptidoglycan-binding domain-containing protein [Anaerolineae bacterium]
MAGAVIAGLRDRTLKSEASPRPVTNTPPPATVLAQAPAPTVEETEPGLALEAATVSTATPVPPTPTVTPVPTDTDTPTPAPTDTATPTPGPRVHVVQAGDVLGSIALEYDLELDELLAANPGLTERSLLRLGQEIVIPAKAASAEAPASEAPAEAAAPKVHVIESGDNLLYLAEKYGVTVAQILAVNPDLTERSILRLGQEVIIPTQAPEASVPTPAPEPTATPEPQFIEHSIESGDTLGYLASKYDTTVDDILAANPGMTEWTVLRLGQIVRVPAPPQSGGPDPEPTPEPVAEATATPEPAALAAATASTASLMSMGGPAQPRALEPLSPRGGAQVAAPELILMWTGVGDLAPDLWYVVHVWQVGEPNDTLTGWTRATSWRPTEDLIARWGENAHLYWDVGIGREIAVAGSGQPRFEPAGPRTEPQEFHLVVK